MKTFLELCITGKAAPEEIDDYVDAWHSGDGKLSMHEFLGMTWDEYSLWVSDPASLKRTIVLRRKALAGKSQARRNSVAGKVRRIVTTSRAAKLTSTKRK
ncbi:hypothetical protein BH09SUM1_BH09SUM1_16130 [soil metagenome]